MTSIINEILNGIIAGAASAAEIQIMQSFNDKNILSGSLGFFCVPSVKSMSFSPRIQAADGAAYGFEGEILINVRIFGKRCGYSDFSQLENAVSLFTEHLGLRSDCIALKLERHEIIRSSLSGRLEGGVTAALKIFVMDGETANE